MGTPIIPFKDRTFERGRRCQNCKHFDSGDLARQHYKARRAAEIKAARMQLAFRGAAALPDDALVQAAKLAGQGMTPEKAVDQVIAAGALNREMARKSAFDVMIEAGAIGICRAGKTPGDFCEAAFFCDHWTGTTGALLATDGKQDLLPEEMYDSLGEKPPEKK